MLKYYKKAFISGLLLGLVRLENHSVERYDGNEVWTKDWDGSGQAYMDIIGMGDWYLYSEVSAEDVEEVKRAVDEKYKKGGHFAYNNTDHPV